MPICLCAPEEKPQEKPNAMEWREPPGMLGVYVRRVKMLAAAQPKQEPKAQS
jgi:hypothetical protein